VEWFMTKILKFSMKCFHVLYSLLTLLIPQSPGNSVLSFQEKGKRYPHSKLPDGKQVFSINYVLQFAFYGSGNLESFESNTLIKGLKSDICK
jgi:hypothetical protein